MKNFRVALFTILALGLFIATTACTQSAATLLPTTTTIPTAALTATSPPTMEPGDVTRNVTVNDLERSYLLHIPPGLDSSQPVAVLFAFHGADMSPDEMKLSMGFDDIADKDGFLVIYPEGMEHTWNVGTCCGYAAANNIDDIAFVRQIVSDIGTVANVDSNRIFATGFSNGASLVYQLACEMSDVFAGIAPVAGVMVFSPCQPQQPVSLIHIHGLDDIIVPYAGGGSYNTPPVEEVIAKWVKIDGCTGPPQTEILHKIINHTAYSSCETGTAVDLYAIEFGGHAWQSMSVWSGSQAIWDFFAAHPKQ